MKTLCILFIVVILSTFSTMAQIATYKSENGHTVYMKVSSSFTTFQIDNNQPFNMVMNGTQNGWFMYSSPSGGITVSFDMQTLAVIYLNPPSTTMFTLVNMSSDGVGYNSYGSSSGSQQYQSGRSRAQIQADINHNQRLMQDAKRNQANDTSITGQIGYNGIIQRYEQRLNELYQELNNANY